MNCISYQAVQSLPKLAYNIISVMEFILILLKERVKIAGI